MVGSERVPLTPVKLDFGIHIRSTQGVKMNIPKLYFLCTRTGTRNSMNLVDYEFRPVVT